MLQHQNHRGNFPIQLRNLRIYKDKITQAKRFENAFNIRTTGEISPHQLRKFTTNKYAN